MKGEALPHFKLTLSLYQVRLSFISNPYVCCDTSFHVLYTDNYVQHSLFLDYAEYTSVSAQHNGKLTLCREKFFSLLSNASPLVGLFVLGL